MIYVVLGMHKSGTTLLSQILHASGIRMGDYADVEGDYNHGVFCERTDVRALNRDILAQGDPAQNFPTPPKITMTEGQREFMQRIIRHNEDVGGDWGFKDPRTCLTYHLWSEELPEHRLVVVIRPFEEVWRHFRAHESPRWLAWRFVRTWCDYNERILRALESSSVPSIVINYQALMNGDHEFARLQHFVGRKLKDAREPGRYRSTAQRSLRLSGVSAVRRLLGRSCPGPLMRELDDVWRRQAGQGQTMDGFRSPYPVAGTAGSHGAAE